MSSVSVTPLSLSPATSALRATEASKAVDSGPSLFANALQQRMSRPATPEQRPTEAPKPAPQAKASSAPRPSTPSSTPSNTTKAEATTAENTAESNTPAAPTPVVTSTEVPLNPLGVQIAAANEAAALGADKAAGREAGDHDDDTIDDGALAQALGLPALAGNAPQIAVPDESRHADGEAEALSRGGRGLSDRSAANFASSSRGDTRNAAELAAAKEATRETAATANETAALLADDRVATSTGNAGDASLSTPANSFQASLEAAQQAQRITSSVPTGHPVSRSEAPVGSHAWNQEVTDRVVWMAGQKESRADLVLHPPQLGRIEISLTVSGDQANATFVAANPNVRDALENAIPRLREALGDAGIQLGQASVDANSSQFASQQGETGHNPASGGRRNAADSALARDAGSDMSALPASTSTVARWQQQGNSLVDAFA